LETKKTFLFLGETKLWEIMGNFYSADISVRSLISHNFFQNKKYLSHNFFPKIST